jgi:superfamily I DNA/RNA helicase
MTRFTTPDDWLPTDGINLTPEQNNVVRATNRNIAIIAGPGTGKTEVLAQKATYLLQTGICRAPFRILTLCYKVDAATNIRERVQKRCPQDLAYRFQSMTTDSFVISLVRRFAMSLPDWLKIKRDFEVVEKIDDVDYLRSLNASSFPNIYKKKLDLFIENVDVGTKNLYQYAAKNNFFDYDMCHTMAYYIVRNNSNIRDLFSKAYAYVFLDEFQDMTNRHYEILKLLFNNNHNKISAVGDYNQAIMGWAGAIPNIFNTFRADFNTDEYHFSYNYRSAPQIVKFINRVVNKLTPKAYIPITYQSNKPTNPTSFIAARYFASVSEEAVYIAQCINKIKVENPDLAFGDFAIILKQKTADYLTNAAISFTAHNISVRNEDAKVCENGVKFQDLMVDNLSKLTIYLLKSKLRIISVTEQKEFNYLLSTILSLDLNKSRDIRKLHETKRKIIKNDFSTAKAWMWSILSVIPKTKICNKLYPNPKSFKEVGVSVLDLLQKCVEAAGENLSSAIDEYMGVNSVRLMTTHKSKGLEFDTVFFADFSQNSWWTLNKTLSEKEEALRCFFVGLSRAKKRLFFTSPTNNYPDDIANILNDSEIVTQYNPIST